MAGVAVPTEADRSLASMCFACHGPDGRSQAPAIPSLAGLPETYFKRTMRAYQYGGRYSTVMGRIALGFDESEIARLARYFSRQTPENMRQRIDWRRIDRGRQLHRRLCRECHGDLQRAPHEDAARLNGAWMAYLRWTLQDYLVGINQGDPGMSDALIKLVREVDGEGLEDLIQYYGSARP